MLAYSVCFLAQSCPTLCDLTDCSPPGSSVHGILEARILGWIAVSYSRGSSRSRDQPMSLANPALAGRFFTTTPPRKLIFLILYTYMLFLLNYLKVCSSFETSLLNTSCSAPEYDTLPFSYIVTLKKTNRSLSSVQSLSPVCNCSTPGFPVHHQLPKLAQTLFHRVCDAIQP